MSPASKTETPRCHREDSHLVKRCLSVMRQPWAAMSPAQELCQHHKQGARLLESLAEISQVEGRISMMRSMGAAILLIYLQLVIRGRENLPFHV